MGKSITHKANGREYLFVEVPEGYDYTLFNKGYVNAVGYVADSPFIGMINGEMETGLVVLPDGNYEEIGLTNELSEQQAAEVVGRSQYDSSVFEMYDTRQLITIHATQALHSLTRSHGMNNPLILQKI